MAKSQSVNMQSQMSQTARSMALQPARFSPGIVWAFLGILIVVLNVHVFSSWITGPYFRPVPMGSDIPPGWMIVVSRLIEATSVSSYVLIFYLYVVKPWRRDGEISSDGLMVLALTTIYWQNVLSNYFVTTTLLSSTFYNWGSWYMYIPGWVSPNMQNMPEAPIGWALSFATWFVFIPMKLAAWAMQKTREKYPQLGASGLFGIFFVGFMTLDLVMEGFFLRTGMYAYAGVVRNYSLWGGQTYQFPIYEFVGMGFAWALYASMYFWRDDHGRTFAEKGIDSIRASRPTKKFIRFLALTGVFNLIMALFGNLPVALGGLNADAWPTGYPSYLTNGICGPDTAYDCPRPDLPIARQTAPTNRIVPLEAH